MSDYTFTYSKNVDFAGAVNELRLDETIKASDITVGLRGVSVEGDVVSIVFKANLSTAETEELDAIVQAHDGTPSEVESFKVALEGLNTVEGRLEVSSYPSSASRVNLITHRWNDKTTWYTMSQLVTNEAPEVLNPDKSVYVEGTDEWTGKRFKLSNTYIINATHGKIFMENYTLAPNGLTYAAVVTIDGVVVDEVNEDTGEGSWALDYVTGVLTLNPNLHEGADLRVTYYYATTSDFFLRPMPTKILELRSVEVQFTEDISLRDTMVFESFGAVGAFAPQLIGEYKDALGNTFSATDSIQLKEPVEYKTLFDYANESNGVYPVIPGTKNNSPTWRDSRSALVTFPWNYQSVIPLSGAAGMFVRIYLVNDTPFDGEFSTATFYCYSKDDPNAT